MKSLSELFSELSVRARQLEGDVASIKKEAKEKIEARRAELHTRVETGLNDINAAAQNVEGDISSSLTALKEKISSDISHVKQKVSEKVIKIDANIAARRADSYESDAALSVQYALYGIDQAEVAVLDAMAARAQADSFKKT